jgi:phage head maturation protease
VAEPSTRNAVSIVLPADGFANVARLVAAGVGSQLSFGFEAIDDLQLAIELALRSVPGHDGRATVSLERDEGGLTVTVKGSEGRALHRRVSGGNEGLDLLSCLARLVDQVDVVEGAAPAVVLRKNRHGVDVVSAV